MLAFFSSFMRDTRGATAIDYSLIIAIVSIAGIAAMRAMGVKAATVMNTVANTLS